MEIKTKKYNLIKKIIKLSEKYDEDILDKALKSIDFAYKNRIFYIADIELDMKKNNGEIVLKAGWTRSTVKSRFSDKRNGYIGVSKIYKEYKINPKLAEELNTHINNKFACGRSGAIYDFMGKTEMIDINIYTIEEVIIECDKFIEKNKDIIKGRGKIN